MITIKHVARRAGVSPTTASYALNNRENVKDETRRKVIQAAQELNYIPNKLAQNFRYGRTNTITVVTGESIELGNTFSSEFFGILACAKERQYDVMVQLITDGNDTKQIQHIFGSRVSDGYILLGNKLDFAVKHVTQNKLPSVLLSDHSECPIAQVNVNGKKGISALTELAFKLKKRNPAYLMLTEGTTEQQLRMDGFLDVIHAHGLDSERRIYKLNDHSPDGLNAVAQSCLENNIDVMICWNDVLANCIMTCLLQKGVQIPQKIAITGFDDISEYNSSLVPLTTVKQPFFDKGKKALDLLIQQIESETLSDEKIFLECILHQRVSL